VKIPVTSPARRRTLLAKENLADLRGAKEALDGLRIDPEDLHSTWSLSIALRHIENARGRIYAEETVATIPVSVRELLMRAGKRRDV